MFDVEILARVERRRKWSIEEKAVLIAEVEAEGGKVKLVAQRRGISVRTAGAPPAQGFAAARQ